MAKFKFSPRVWAATGVAVAAAAASSPASAVLINATLSDTTATSTVTIGGLGDGDSANGTTANVEVGGFNTTLGTLTSVQLSFSDQFILSGIEFGSNSGFFQATLPGFDEEGGAQGVAGCQMDSNISFGADGTVTTLDGNDSSASVDYVGSDSRTNLQGVTTFFQFDETGSTSANIPAGFGSGPFNAFLSTWDLDFQAIVDTISLQVTCTGVGNFQCVSPTGTGFIGTTDEELRWDISNIEVVYNYDPAAQIPEPGTLALFGAGLGMFGASYMARRRRRTQA